MAIYVSIDDEGETHQFSREGKAFLARNRREASVLVFVVAAFTQAAHLPVECVPDGPSRPMPPWLWGVVPVMQRTTGVRAKLDVVFDSLWQRDQSLSITVPRYIEFNFCY